jgi:hypothetical protein
MRASASLLVLPLLAGCAGSGDDIRNRPLAANPSAFIAAEMSFARLAQDKGQWTAFRETSAPEAVMFVPQRVKARDWLKGQKDPATAVKWQPHAVYVSCDGNAGATTGAWQNGAENGYFTTVWIRDAKGRFSWILDHGDTLSSPREAPDFIASKQAACGTRPDRIGAGAAEAGAEKTDTWSDTTLQWSSIVHTDGSRRVTIRLWDGSSMATVIDDQVAAPTR